MTAWKTLLILALVMLAALLGSLNGLTGEEQDTPGAKVLTIRELPEFRITKGEVLYDRYCAFCHGDTGAGDGLNAYSIPVKPRNFNDRTVSNLRTNEFLAEVIRYGGDYQGLSNYMPVFDKSLSAGQVGDLVDFIRTELGNHE
jgi:mono/diheme cytochrome c family protein